MIHYVGGGGSDYGYDDHIRITWDDDPFTYGSFNNHVLQDCRNLDTNTVWPDCRYAAHSGDTWQSCSFSFTANGMLNDYSGNQWNRIILGPTARPGG